MPAMTEDTTAQPAGLDRPFVITATNARGEALTIEDAPEFRAAGGVWLDRALYAIRSGRTADGTVNRVHAFRVAYPDRGTVAELVRQGEDVVDLRTGRDVRRASLAWTLVNGRDLATNAPAYGADPAGVAADLAAMDAASVRAGLQPAPEAPADVVEPAPAVLVVVPCGRAKLDHAAPAGDLYTGSAHRLARQAADAVAARTPGARVVILSALHGLLDLADVVEPYDVTIGDPDAITGAELAAQLAATGARRVLALTPKHYSAALAVACDVTGAELADHLAGSRGLPEQRGRLARLRDNRPAPQPAESAPAVVELVEEPGGQFALAA